MSTPSADRRAEEDRDSGSTVSWFELFYDLVVVAAVSLCNDAYVARPSWGTALAALLSIAALSWVWLLTTVFNNVFPGDDLIRRLLLLAQTAFIVIAALSVDQDGLRNSVGLAAYGASMLVIGILVLRERGGIERAAVVKSGLVSVTISAGICFTGAFLPVDYAGLALLLALAVSVGSALMARLHTPRAASLLRVDHLRERRGLFILIILGEGFAELVHALHSLGSIPRGGVFALTFLLSFALWWIYFDGTFSERLDRVLDHWRLSLLAHLTLIYGMAGTLDLLVLVTAQEEEVLGDASLLYFGVCLATVFFSFAVLGLTVRGRFGAPGWVQACSGLLVLGIGAAATAGTDRSVNAVMVTAAVLVIGNALFAVWVDRAAEVHGWRNILKAVMGGQSSRDELLD